MSEAAVRSLFVVSGICLYASVVHLLIALRRRIVTHALFGLICLLAFAYVLGAAHLYQTSTVDAYISVARMQDFVGLMWAGVFAWFVAFHTGRRPVRFLLAQNALCVCVIVLNWILPNSLLFSEIHGMTSRVLPWGEGVSTVDAVTSPLAALSYLPALLSLGFAYVCCLGPFRRQTSAAIVLAVATSLQLLALVITVLIDFNGLQFISVEEFAFISFVLLMTFSLANELEFADRAVRQSEAQKKAILASLCEHIAVIDRAGTIVAVNPAWEDFAQENQGSASACNRGANYLEICQTAEGDDAEEAADVALQLQELLDGRSKPFTLEYPCHSSNEERWFLMHATSLRSEQGGAVVSHTNITQRKQAELALRRTHDLNESLINTARIIVLVLDETGRIVRFNPYMEELTGWRLDEVVGNDWLDVFVPEHERPRIRSLFNRAIAGQRVHGNVNSIVSKDGRERQIEWYDAPLSGADGQLTSLLCTGQDVTERQTLQREILKIAADEQRRIGQELHDGTQQQLTGLGLLAQNVADSLKKLIQADEIASVLQQAALVEPMTELSRKAGQVRHGVEEAAREVNQLARGLLPVELDAQGLMSSLSELARRVNAVNEFECTFEIRAKVEIADSFSATHVYRIAQEAVNNAIKHSGGDRIEMTISEKQRTVSLTIRDNGKGIDEEQIGSGMGLRIMAYRAELIGAELAVVKSPRGGVEVVCTLPSA